MSEPRPFISASENVAFFLKRLENYRLDHNAHALEANVALAVGFLLGAELPGAAAAVALLAEERFPDGDWRWKDKEPAV